MNKQLKTFAIIPHKKSVWERFLSLMFEFICEFHKIYSRSYTEYIIILVISYIQLLYYPLKSDVSITKRK